MTQIVSLSLVDKTDLRVINSFLKCWLHKYFQKTAVK